MIGYKLLRADGSSLRDEFRVYYPLDGSWIDVPGNGAYVAVTDGLLLGGYGPLLVEMECDEERHIMAQWRGVRNFGRVRVLRMLDHVALSGVVYAFSGALIRAGKGARVRAEKGAIVRTVKGSRIRAKSGVIVRGRGAAVSCADPDVHAFSGATVYAYKDATVYHL